jgi:prepilin-type N-terminal cleavage/methylation domain-containing protein
MRNRGGFTIVESLIALAISSSLFVIMMVMFNGRQARVEFSQGMRDIESYILDVANDVRNGYYPSVGNQVCSVDVATGNVKFSSGTTLQGTSNECVFAGNLLLFDSSVVPGQIKTFSLAGDKNATNLTSLKPTPIGNLGNETQKDYKIPGGISLVKNDLSKTSVLIGFVFDIAGVGVQATDTKKISSIVPYQLNLIGDTTMGNIKFASLNTASYVPIGSDGKTLCFLGSNGQTGSITIRRAPDGLSTSLQIGQSLTGVPCTVGV